MSRTLRRAGLRRMHELEPAEPVRRYERATPGELIHIDIKKLGRLERVGHRITGDRKRQSNDRGVGWELVHLVIPRVGPEGRSRTGFDDSRIALSQIMPGERAVRAVAVLKAAFASYESLGVTVARVMTDHGRCYRAFAFRDACKALALGHIRTRACTPKTNGKAERLIQSALREWACSRAYPASDERAAEPPLWLHRCNWHRPHGGLKAMTPISRLDLSEDNLLKLQS